MYYKITNSTENHHGYRHKDGLFAETCSCCVGGFYFTDIENILQFLEYGIYLGEITLPVNDDDFKMVKDQIDETDSRCAGGILFCCHL